MYALGRLVAMDRSAVESSFLLDEEEQRRGEGKK